MKALTRKNSRSYKASYLARIVVNQMLAHCQVKVECDCPDFRYRFAYLAYKKGYGSIPEDRPAVKTNPNNKGRCCKHIARLFLRSSDWTPRLVSPITQLIKKYRRITDKMDKE